jgi:hypothetical protein
MEIVRGQQRRDPARSGDVDQSEAELGEMVEVHDLRLLALEERCEGRRRAGVSDRSRASRGGCPSASHVTS